MNQLNQHSITDSTQLCATLELTANTHGRASKIINSISLDMTGLDSATTHDTSVAVQIAHGNKNAALTMNVASTSGGGVEALEYDTTW